MAKSIASLLSESDCGCKVVDEARSKELGDGKWEYEGKVGVWRTLSNGDRAFFPDDGGAPLAAARTLKHPSNGGKTKVVDRRTIREGLNEAKLKRGQGPDLNVMLNFDLKDGKAYIAELIVVSDAKIHLYAEETLFPQDSPAKSFRYVENAIRDAYKKVSPDKKIDLGVGTKGVVFNLTKMIYDTFAKFEAAGRGVEEEVVAHLIAGEDGKVKILTGLKRVAVGNQYQYRDPSEPEKRGTPASQIQEGAGSVVYPEQCKVGQTYKVGYRSYADPCIFRGWSLDDEGPRMTWEPVDGGSKWEAYMYHGYMAVGSSADKITIHSA